MHDKQGDQSGGGVMSSENEDPVRLFEGLDTPGVSDATDKLGLPGHCFGISPLDNYANLSWGAPSRSSTCLPPRIPVLLATLSMTLPKVTSS